MQIPRILKLTTIILLFYYGSTAQIPERKGWWKFDNPSELSKAETGYGQALTLTGSHYSASGPEINNGAVRIGIGSYYKMDHLIPANGGGSFVNEYTLQYDFKVPVNSIWHSFFQTSVTNANDADLFINPSGNIGVAAVGYSSYSVLPNEWYRLVVSVKNGHHFTYYLDGKLLLNGTIQTIDGRFSIENLLLIFADDNSEDGEIYCSELAIWDKALDAVQVAELGGYGHNPGSVHMVMIPYLQSPSINSMVVCWHDTVQATPGLLYGTSINPDLYITGSSEIIKDSYYWNTIKITGLEPQTNYYYKMTNGRDTSETYVFKTWPDTLYQGKMRFLILGDTHASDTTMSMKILKKAREKLVQLYGPGFQDSVQAIIHSGDLVVDGNSIDHYTVQYFRPMSSLSANIGTFTVAGNHEGENPNFYRYMKLDDYSAFPLQPGLNEKIWQFRIGNTLFIGLNTNITATYGTTEADWVDSQLEIAENNPSIDFVFIVFHHPPFSELWYDVINFDNGPEFVNNTLFPIIKKYTKVQQVHYGHTHGFERGTIRSEKPGGDFRIICGGGSGGPLDPWNPGAVFDYHDIHKTFSEYFFQIMEVDVANHSYRNTVYSLGNLAHPKNLGILDQWYKKLDQSKPASPTIESINIINDKIQIKLSSFSGVDSLMTVRLQFQNAANASETLLDTMFHWQNVFGVDNQGLPIDKNQSLNLNSLEIPVNMFSSGKSLLVKSCYRDHNLKWSDWSNSIQLLVSGTHKEQGKIDNSTLDQNFPNPFQDNTLISYHIQEKSSIKFKIYDSNFDLVQSIDQGIKYKGVYRFNFNGTNLNPGVYYYQLNADNVTLTKKMVKIK